jgi:hypothetical protein
MSLVENFTGDLSRNLPDAGGVVGDGPHPTFF